MPSGGKREGAGRKPKDDSGAATATSIWLSPAQHERLQHVAGKLKIPYSDVMELGIKAAESKLKRKKE